MMPKAKSILARKKVTISGYRLNLNKSYIGLLYGIATVVILFVVVFLGLRSNINRQGSVDNDAAKTSQEQQAQNQGNTYTTVEGDTLWSIAEKQYKSGYNWVDIAKANDVTSPSELEVGTKLIIPVVTPIIVAQADPSVMPSQTPTISVPTPTQVMVESPKGGAGDSTVKIIGSMYVVVKDDNLWNIAERAYGDGFKWTEIAKANNLENPRIIHSGNELKLPR